MSIELRVELPLPPTINHYYFTNPRTGQRIMTSKAKAWMEEVRQLIKLSARQHSWILIEREKVIMQIWVYWSDNRRRDIHNLHKALADAPEGIIYADDRQVLIHDADFTVDRARPRVEIGFVRKVEAI